MPVGQAGGAGFSGGAAGRCGGGAAAALRYAALLEPLCREPQLVVGNTISSHRPDLLQIQLQTLRQLAASDPAGVFQPFRHPLLAAPPDLHRPLLGQQQPAEAGAIGLILLHLAAQGGDASGPFVSGAS